MHVTITCRACGLKFKVHSRFSGKVGACPRPECGRKFLVPPEPAAAPGERAPVTAAAHDRPATAQPGSGAAEPAPNDDDVAWLYQHAGVAPEPDSRPASAHPVSTPARPAAAPRNAAAKKRESPPASPVPAKPAGQRSRVAIAAALGLLLMLIGVVAVIARPRAATTSGSTPLSAQPASASTAAEQAAEQRRAEQEKRALEQAALFDAHVQPYLKKYCNDCHAGDNAEAGIVLDRFPGEEPARKDRKLWEKVARMLDAGAMPPGDHPQRPTAAETRPIIAWMDERVFRVDCDVQSDPGRVTVRRLNRNEYNNTIRDLLGITFKPADDFPSDDVGHGFDNIGDVLSLPPLLMEKYLDAAEKIAEAAILVVNPKGEVQRAEGDELKKSGQFAVGEDNTIGIFSAGYVHREFPLPAAGDYFIRVEASADQAGDEPARVELRLDGKAVKTFDVTGQNKLGVYETRLKIDSGRHTVAAAFINDYYNPKARNPRDRDRNLYVKSIEIQGPVGGMAALPESHRRLVTARPENGVTLHDAASRVLTPLARRAFRRPVSDAELQPFVRLVEFANQQGDSYERGLQVALQAILVSPQFLFRIERDPEPDNPKASRLLTDFELATRLSYFLWSSMPDDELFRLAEKNELHQPAVLKQQTARMLADPRSRAFVENFGGQWLNLRNLDELRPDPKLFPEFDPALRADMRKETELFFESIVREDRSLLDVLDGSYTFLNNRLAKHYGLPDPGGNEFKKVDLADNRRGGILTQASILTLTSDPTKTSPVKRGKWILENILGAPPPPAPPNVPELAATQKANPNATLRQQLEIHRKNPACATCHQQMDPLGLGFENFDAIGRWRDMDNGHKVDSSGKLPSGEAFQGPAELRTILKGRQKQFTRHFAAQLLTYALGRGLEPSDQCTLDAIVQAAEKNNHRFSAILNETIASETFQKRRGEGSTP